MKAKEVIKIIVIAIIILVFVLSYVDFGIRANAPQQEQLEFQNPTSPPSAEGPTGPPPKN